MSAKGCSHLQAFKKIAKNLETIKWIHAVFVVGTTAKNRRTKICNAYCRSCKKRMPFLHACMECVYFGCHKHIREHTKTQKHTFSIDLAYGQIHCQSCNDYVYDSEIDEITLQNKMQSGKFKKRLFEWSQWDPSEEERELLMHRTKRICITPQSTIGLRGLLNLGHTCFMNCIVQALMHTPLLRDYFLNERHKCRSIPGMCLVCEVSKVFQEFYKGVTVPLALHRMLHLIWTQARHLAGYEQQDAHEFFIATLDMLHQHCRDSMPVVAAVVNDANDSGCACIIDQIFTGGLQSDIVCQKCNGVSTKNEPILDLSLDLGPATSLIDCLEQYTRAEHLGHTEKIMCSNCNSYQESTKQLTMKKLPVVISIHLKRFEHVKTKSGKQYKKKISTSISFPEMLDMTPFMNKSEECSPFPPDKRYSLFAVINHMGSFDGGHYTAFVRQQHDYWYRCDDHVITKAKLQEVLDSEGYLLFYHKHVLSYD